MPLGEKKALTNFIKYLNTFSLKQQPLDASVRVKDVLHSDVKFQNVLSSPKRNMNYRIPDFVKLFGDMKINVRPNNEHPDRKKWKMRNTAVKSVDVGKRTDHILESLQCYGELTSQINWRLEVLLNHLDKYPGINEYAVKKGAIGIVLSIKNHIKRDWFKMHDPKTDELIRVVLAALGYAPPPGSSGIRILSIDGGGMRGLAVLRMLQMIEKVSRQRIYESFDLICGVSTGALITSGLIPPNQMSLERICNLYLELSRKVFDQSAVWGTSKLFWKHAYYDTALWEKMLKDYVGNLELINTNKNVLCPKIAIVSTVVNRANVEPFIFRNYGNPCYKKSEYQGSYRHSLFDAVRASAAAPALFEEFRTGHILHQDGGLVTNNPTAIALHEARSLWPKEPISCVVSLGTGKYDPSAVYNEDLPVGSATTSWKQTFDKILQSATDTEGVHRILNDLLPENIYFRLNPHLSEKVNMDETSPARLGLLQDDTEMYCRRNEERFLEISKKIQHPRTFVQQKRDVIQSHMRTFGFMQ